MPPPMDNRLLPPDLPDDFMGTEETVSPDWRRLAICGWIASGALLVTLVLLLSGGEAAAQTIRVLLWSAAALAVGFGIGWAAAVWNSNDGEGE